MLQAVKLSLQNDILLRLFIAVCMTNVDFPCSFNYHYSNVNIRARAQIGRAGYNTFLLWETSLSSSFLFLQGTPQIACPFSSLQMRCRHSIILMHKRYEIVFLTPDTRYHICKKNAHINEVFLLNRVIMHCECLLLMVNAEGLKDVSKFASD